MPKIRHQPRVMSGLTGGVLIVRTTRTIVFYEPSSKLMVMYNLDC